MGLDRQYILKRSAFRLYAQVLQSTLLSRVIYLRSITPSAEFFKSKCLVNVPGLWCRCQVFMLVYDEFSPEVSTDRFNTLNDILDQEWIPRWPWPAINAKLKLFIVNEWAGSVLFVIIKYRWGKRRHSSLRARNAHKYVKVFITAVKLMWLIDESGRQYQVCRSQSAPYFLPKRGPN